jgi:hypothetical protein
MRGFIAHLRAAWQYARYIPVISSLDHEDEWTKEDERWYSSICKSPSGQKLRNRARKLMAISAVNATQASQRELARRCGWASGVTAAFSWQDTHLSQADGEQSAPEESEQGASDDLAQLAAP